MCLRTGWEKKLAAPLAKYRIELNSMVIGTLFFKGGSLR